MWSVNSLNTVCRLDNAPAQGQMGLLLLRGGGLPELWAWISDCPGNAKEEINVFQSREREK